MMETDNPFEKTLDRLRTTGWCQFALGPEEGPNCLNGALIYHKASQKITNDIAKEQFPDRVGTYPYWYGMNFNNHVDTTFNDIEMVLNKAAIKWEEDRVLRD